MCSYKIAYLPPCPRMPAGQADAPVLVLDCDREFETDTEQAEQHLKRVAEFISSL